MASTFTYFIAIGLQIFLLACQCGITFLIFVVLSLNASWSRLIVRVNKERVLATREVKHDVYGRRQTANGKDYF